MNRPEMIRFILEDGTEANLEILEETKINGVNYLLVIDSDNEEQEEAMILKEKQVSADEVVYIPVEDDKELEVLSKVFMELLDDIEFEK